MKVNLYEAGGRLEGGFTIPGMTLTGPLLLSGKVSSPLEAIHKQYIDTAITNLDAASFVSGSIATARLPGLIGDVTSSNSSNVVTLNASGVIAGDYTKLTVDAKGRVTTGLSLTEADLPNIGWGKIAEASKPTTLAGYGITDGVSTVNGTITGSLTLVGNPTEDNHAATKAYADANVAGSVKIVTGDIVSLVSNITPTSFLRCNGGVVSKTTYSALYAVVGDTFTLANTQPGSGLPWRQQYQINTTQTSNITSWATSGSIPAAIDTSQVVVTKNRVYLLGGRNSSGAPTSTVYTAPINTDGTLGAWTTSTALPTTLDYSNVVVTKNRVYLIGGRTSGTTYSAAVYTAPINTDGTLGTWTTATALPKTVSSAVVFVAINRVYVLGGYGGGTGSSGNSHTHTNTYSAPINTDGTLGAWVSDTPLPVGMSLGQPIITKNRIYIASGIINGSYSAAVYTAPINTDGTLGAWTTAVSLPGILSNSQAFVTKDRAYLLGGINSNAVATVYTAPINTDGTLGTWAAGTSLSATLANTQAVVTQSRIYLLGGLSGGAYTATIYTATITGGLNDYSLYYDGSITPTDINSFKLPDYTSYEKTSMYFFIKS